MRFPIAWTAKIGSRVPEGPIFAQGFTRSGQRMIALCYEQLEAPTR